MIHVERSLHGMLLDRTLRKCYPSSYWQYNSYFVSESTAMLQVGRFTTVKYDQCLYPGIIMQINQNNGAEVSVLHKVVGGWNWPSIPDEIDYRPEDIIQPNVMPLIPVNSRGLLKFESNVELHLKQ